MVVDCRPAQQLQQVACKHGFIVENLQRTFQFSRGNIGVLFARQQDTDKLSVPERDKYTYPGYSLPAVDSLRCAVVKTAEQR